MYAFLARDAPSYIPGYSICIASLAFTLLTNTTYFIALLRENRKRDRLQAKGVYSGLTEEEKKQMGDLNPDYRYYT